MRTIKFRAWDNLGKELIGPNDFFQLADKDSPLKKGCHLSDFFEIHEDGTIGKEHEDVVFMQFIGLLDKNEKEIYEGDLVRYWDYNVPLEVIWCNDGCASFKVKAIGFGNLETINTDKGIEVIGNIYENPELLTKSMNNNKTPQWEIEFEQRFGGEGRYLCQWDEGMNAWASNHEEVKAFIKSTLEEVIETIPTEITSTSPDGDEIGIYSADLKAQLRKEFL